MGDVIYNSWKIKGASGLVTQHKIRHGFLYSMTKAPAEDVNNFKMPIDKWASRAAAAAKTSCCWKKKTFNSSADLIRWMYEATDGNNLGNIK